LTSIHLFISFEIEYTNIPNFELRELMVILGDMIFFLMQFFPGVFIWFPLQLLCATACESWV